MKSGEMDFRHVGVGVLVALCGSVLPAQDGTMWLGAPSQTATVRYRDGQYWNGYQVAGNGGVATLTGYSFANVRFPSALTLGGIDFRSGYQASDSASFAGESGVTAVSFTGAAFLTGTSAAGPRLNVTLQGTAQDSLTKKGSGRIRLLTNTSGFGTVRVADGVLRQETAVDGRVFADATVGALEIAGGTAQYAPAAAGTSVLLPPLRAGRGAGVLPVLRGTTMTAPSLTAVDGGALVITNSAGPAALGTTEKLLLAAEPTLQHGMLDPRVVTRDHAQTGAPFSFLTYDAAKGVVPYSESALVDLSDASADDVAVVNPAEAAADVAVDEDRHVGALVVNNRANLKIAAGKTLTVGDGVHPAGVIFREQTDVATSVRNGYSQFDCAGTLDFGSAHGVIWKGTPGTNTGRGLDLYGKISGSAGITFTSHPQTENSRSATLLRLFNDCCAWTGPTFFYNTRVWMHGATRVFPDGGDVYVLGNGVPGSAGLYFWGLNGTFNQHFHLSGTSSVDGAPGLFLGAGTDGLSLSGRVTVEDALTVRAARTSSIDGPLDGPGNLSFDYLASGATFEDANSGTVRLSGSLADYAGQISLVHSAVALDINQPYALPTNTLTVTKGTLLLTNFTGAVTTVPTPLKGGTDGRVTIENGQLTFTGAVDFPGTFAIDRNMQTNRRSTLAFAQDARIGHLDAVNGFGSGSIEARNGAVALHLGRNAGDNVVQSVLRDGTGTLSFVKEGSNTVTLVATNLYTGATVVKAGTVRLQGPVLESPSVSWWLDAACRETIDTNEAGEVVEWRSRVNDVAFVNIVVSGSSRATYTVNAAGQPAVTFPADGFAGLKTKSNVTQRTVFIVYRLDPADLTEQGNNAGNCFYTLFGRAGFDYGIRVNYASKLFERNISTAKFNTLGYVYQDGVKKTSNFRATTEGWGVLTLQHDQDWIKGDSSAPGAVPSTFVAEIGGYNNSSTRHWAGDVAEAIAFDRLLTEAERQTVENYLSVKWRGAPVHATPDRAETLSAQTALTIEYGATLDLAGGDQTVASLSGAGTICNSSTNPAVLSVTGACMFAGTLRGNMKLVASGATNDLRLVAEDTASLGLVGGTTTLVACTNEPPRAHLAYWLDASDDASVVCASDGTVTNWTSRAGFIPAFSWVMGGTGIHSTTTGPKTYTAEAEGVNGLRTIHFTSNKQELVSCGKVSTRTLFLVAENDGTSTIPTGGYWGKAALDRGIRCSTAAMFEKMGRVTYYLKNDTARLNGVTRDMTSNVNPGTRKPFCLVIRLDVTSHPEDEIQYGETTKIFDRGDALGCYCGVGNGNTNFKACEVLAYTNALSDAEITSVENYLMAKWGVDGRAAETPSTTPFTGTGTLELVDGAVLTGGLALGDATLVVKVAADGSVETVSINGPLALGTGAKLVVDGYARANTNTRHTVLSVSGGVTGAFMSTTPVSSDKKWKLFRQGETWYLVSNSGLKIVFR